MRHGVAVVDGAVDMCVYDKVTDRVIVYVYDIIIVMSMLYGMLLCVCMLALLHLYHIVI